MSDGPTPEEKSAVDREERIRELARLRGWSLRRARRFFERREAKGK